MYLTDIVNKLCNYYKNRKNYFNIFWLFRKNIKQCFHFCEITYSLEITMCIASLRFLL